jgi:transcriptional regulator with XRE-family HTH domain
VRDIYAKIGFHVRERRLYLGMTQEELGERADLHPSYVGQIERGIKKSSLKTLALLADALGASLGELLDQSPQRPRGAWEAKIDALLRDKSDAQKEILYSTLRHLSKELRGRK